MIKYNEDLLKEGVWTSFENQEQIDEFEEYLDDANGLLEIASLGCYFKVVGKTVVGWSWFLYIGRKHVPYEQLKLKEGE